MRTLRSILSRPLISKRMCSSAGGGGSYSSDGQMGKVASSVLGNFSNTTMPTIGQHHLNTPTSSTSFASKLKEATDAKDDRLVTSMASESTDDEEGDNSFSTPAQQGGPSSTFANAVRLRTSEKPFSQRLATRVAEVLQNGSHDMSATLLEADLSTEEIRIATTVVNLKTTLQSNFPIFLAQPISALHLTHICSALVNVHLTALRPEHTFSLVNQREQQMPAFELLNSSADETKTTSIVRGGFGTQTTSYFPKPASEIAPPSLSTGDAEAKAKTGGVEPVAGHLKRQSASKVHLAVSVATAIVDEEFSLTTCKVHADRDNAGLTLLWLTYLHKMSMIDSVFKL